MHAVNLPIIHSATYLTIPIAIPDTNRKRRNRDASIHQSAADRLKFTEKENTRQTPNDRRAEE